MTCVARSWQPAWPTFLDRSGGLRISVCLETPNTGEGKRGGQAEDGGRQRHSGFCASLRRAKPRVPLSAS
eukprot:773630-Lingulodinium_polyedra.AAC.1